MHAHTSKGTTPGASFSLKVSHPPPYPQRSHYSTLPIQNARPQVTFDSHCLPPQFLSLLSRVAHVCILSAQAEGARMLSKPTWPTMTQ